MVAAALFVGLAILTSTQASPVRRLSSRSSRLPPSIDPFYQPPSNYEDLASGTILRHRTVDPPPNINASISAAHQFLYRSTDSQNNANGVVTTLLVPQSAQNDKLFSFQFAYDSPSVDCSPSYALYTNSTQPELAIIAQALNEGWYVSYPDYEGPTAAFTNGIQSGRAVLDSIRTLLASSNITGLAPEARYTVAGASGGSLGSLWAAELQREYAPELDIAGALLTATVPNIANVARSIDGTPYAGLIPAAFLGLAKQSSRLSEWLSAHLRPNTAQAFVEAGTRCAAENLEVYSNVSFQPFFEESVQDYTADSVLTAVATQASDSGSRGTPSTPMFIYKGAVDELSPVADTDALVERFCADEAGRASIEYERALNANHGEGGTAGFTAGWEWLRQRMNGVVVAEGCYMRNVTLSA